MADLLGLFLEKKHDKLILLMVSITDRQENSRNRGGEQMDMFIDKLAQKFTAQEIIKANTTAEAEELKNLREQVEQYTACLDKLKKLVDESAEKLQGNEACSEEIQRLVEESIVKIQAIQQDSAGLEELGEKLETEIRNLLESELTERMADEIGDKVEGRLETAVNRQLENQVEGVLSRQLENRVEGAIRNQLQSQLKNQLDASLQGRLEKEFEKQAENQAAALEAGMEGKTAAVSDAIHKECVKVYRNVQAVILEENEKQKSENAEVGSAVRLMKGKLGKIFGVSDVALIASLLSVALQIMNLLNIKLF